MNARSMKCVPKLIHIFHVALQTNWNASFCVSNKASRSARPFLSSEFRSIDVSQSIFLHATHFMNFIGTLWTFSSFENKIDGMLFAFKKENAMHQSKVSPSIFLSLCRRTSRLGFAFGEILINQRTLRNAFISSFSHSKSFGFIATAYCEHRVKCCQFELKISKKIRASTFRCLFDFRQSQKFAYRI